jgi:hypothetical protein
LCELTFQRNKITSIFRTENQLNKKPLCSRWLGTYQTKRGFDTNRCMVMGPVRPETKNDCAGKGQQKITAHVIGSEVLTAVTMKSTVFWAVTGKALTSLP